MLRSPCGAKSYSKCASRIGAQHLHRVRSARRRVGRLLRQRSRFQIRAPQLVPHPGDRRKHVQRRRVGPPLPEGRVQRADRRALHPQLDVVPRRMLAVLLGHLQRLRIAAMRFVVAAGVAQVDAACERDVALGCRRDAGSPPASGGATRRSGRADPAAPLRLPARSPRRDAGSLPRCRRTCPGASATPAP